MTTVDSILSKYSDPVSSLAFKLREFILKNIKGANEYPDQSANIISYGFGSGYKDTICTIIPSKKGVKLGFNKGTELPDPAMLLTGAGKVHKHVVIKAENDLTNSALQKLLTDALAAYHTRQSVSG